jgi:DNA mismatch repair protein MutS2
MASLEVRLRVGLDGGLRGFEIVRHEEQTTNPFHISALGRFLRRIAFLFRGYRVSDEEMLDRLIDEVFSGVLADLGTLIAALSDVEFYVSALTFADRARRAGLAVCVPEIVAPPGPHAPPIAREIRDLYNPLLFGEGEGPVPCTLTLDRHDATVVLTGPNSGGKTRFVQAIAIAQALGQAGMFVPASSARLVWARGMLVSILQDTAADQHEGRLGMELVRIRNLFERLGPGSVVLLDELCSGTNPSEGEEIFELVTDLLEELEPQSFITTHFLGLASRLAREREGGRFRFLQVELTEEQRPTYRFVPGIATTSLAKQTAARLGVTRENLRALVAKNRARFAMNGAAAPERAAASPRRPIEQAAGHTPEGARDDDA